MNNSQQVIRFDKCIKMQDKITCIAPVYGIRMTLMYDITF